MGWIVFLILCFFGLFFLTLVILGVFGKTLGIRKKYVDILLQIFEYGKERIDKAEMRQRLKLLDADDGPELNGFVNRVSVISREGQKLLPTPPRTIPRNRSFNTLRKEFKLDDSMDFVKAGLEAIIEDEVTQRFAAEELPSWNLLTRTNKNYNFISLRLTVLWGFGFLIRYFILLPVRLMILVYGAITLLISTGLVGLIPEGRLKRWLYWHVSVMNFRIFARSLSSVIRFHNTENRAKNCGVCVANHTSPIDVVVLATDNAYALVGQRQGGFLGMLERALARATHHIWFERSELKDRLLVTKRMSEHVADPNKLPILIFPEGTCINNTSVMMFKKGGFEVGGTIYPVAIKYDARFGDPFWNSSKQGYVHYLLMMMSSWAIVCDVWYLPPMPRKEGENAVDFANRVKAKIAEKGGLIDLVWDGGLKRSQVKHEWKEQQQEAYSQKLFPN